MHYIAECQYIPDSLFSSSYNFSTMHFSDHVMFFSLISPLKHGGTALLLAGWHGHSEVVKLLLGAGARDIPNKVNDVIDGPPLPLLR